MKPVVVTLTRLVRGLRAPSPAANARRLRAAGESVDALVFRDATLDDLPALAELHVTTWNATYGGGGPTAAVREQQWRRAFASPDEGWFVILIARPDGALVGFAAGKRHSDPEPPGFAGELRRIHLLRDYQRLGLGRELLRRVCARFMAQGITSVLLFADPGNPSCGFYERLGAERLLDARGEFHGGYGWRDIRHLL